MIFDTHAHYDDEAFDEDREELVASLPEKGISTVVNVGASIAGSKRSVALAEAYPHVYAAVGVHPDDVAELDEEKLALLSALCKKDKVVAVGEIGLDYYWHEEPEHRDLQKYWFRRQLALAKAEKLPFLIHSREAAKDTLDIIREEGVGERSGVMHCYSYSVEMAREYVKMGMYIALGGVVTFKNARKTKEVAAEIPLEYLLLETDCPYMAPTPFRGKRNSSLYLPYVAEEIARLKGITPQEVIEVTRANAQRFFGL